MTLVFCQIPLPHRADRGRARGWGTSPIASQAHCLGGRDRGLRRGAGGRSESRPLGAVWVRLDSCGVSVLVRFTRRQEWQKSDII